METRDEIVRQIAEHRDEFQPERCEALFVMTVEDLLAGGVDLIRVHAALARAFVRLEVARVGTPATVDVLRNFADAIEHRFMNSQNSQVRN